MEQTKKLEKPLNCEKCPAVRIEKKEIYCVCKRELRADKENYIEKSKMWGNCPLNWK